MEIQYIPGLVGFSNVDNPELAISVCVEDADTATITGVSVCKARCLILTIIIKGQGDSAHEVLQKSLCQREHDKKERKSDCKTE